MATPSMSMNKVIQCAVRRDVKRFCVALDAFRNGDTMRATGLHRAWCNFDAQLTHHHEGEHEIACGCVASPNGGEVTHPRDGRISARAAANPSVRCIGVEPMS